MKNKLFRLSLVAVLLASLVIPILPYGDAKAAPFEPYSKEFTISDIGGGAAANFTQSFGVYYNVAPISTGQIQGNYMLPAESYNGTVYIGSYSSNSSVDIQAYNESTGVMTGPVPVITGFGSYDDHSIPNVGVIKHPGPHQGDVWVASAEHNGIMMLLRSNVAESITSGFTKANGGADLESTNSTYPMIMETDNGTLVLFYRYYTVDGADTYISFSQDQGDTWSTKAQLTAFREFGGPVTYAYPSIKSDGTSSHIELAISPAYQDGVTTYVDVWSAFSPDGGVTWKRHSDNSTLTLPLSDSVAGSVPDKVYETPAAPDHTALANHQYVTHAVDATLDANNNPYITYLLNLSRGSLPSQDSDTYQVRRAYWDGSAWQNETVTNTAGTQFGLNDGGAISAPPTADSTMSTMYIPVKANGDDLEMTKWQKISGTWTLTENITQNSPGAAFKPTLVRGALPTSKIQMIFDYSSNYTVLKSSAFASIFAYPGVNSGSYIGLKKQSRADFQDIRFTQSDNVTLQPSTTSGRPWLADITENWSATAWVNVGNVPLGGNVKTTMFWGDTALTNVNDQATMDSMFYFADHFNGASANTSKWNITAGSPVFSDSKVRLTPTGVSLSTFMTNNATNYPNPLYGEYRAKIMASTDNTALSMGWVLVSTGLERGGLLTSTVTPNTLTMSTRLAGTITTNDYTPDDRLSWHDWSIRWTSGLTDLFRNDIWLARTITNVSNQANNFNIYTVAGSGYYDVDYAFIRNITYPLPSVSTTSSQTAFGALTHAKSVDKDGVVTANVTANLTDVGSTSTHMWVEYWITGQAVATTANVSYETTGLKTVTLPTTLTPGQTYNFRFGATNADGTSYSSTSTFTLTMSSVSTGAVTDAFSGKPFNVATLHGTVGSMGVASSVYYHWEYGPDGSYGQSTPEVTVSSPGSFQTTVSGYPDTWLSGSIHARFVVRVGSVSVNGADQSFAFPSSQNGLGSAIAVLLLIALVVAGFVEADKKMKNSK